MIDPCRYQSKVGHPITSHNLFVTNKKKSICKLIFCDDFNFVSGYETASNEGRFTGPSSYDVGLNQRGLL